MDVSIKNITENYKDRMERLVLFDPLYILGRKTGRDNSGKSIDYYGLGLLTLLFFFENMLIRNKKAGVLQLAEFLSELTQKEYDLNNTQLAEHFSLSRNTVSSWKKRFSDIK